MKDCESLEELTEEGFEELDEQGLSYGQWLRASPLPKMTEDKKKKDSSSGTCSKNLFQSPTNQSRCGSKGKEIMEEAEVQQAKELEEIAGAEKFHVASSKYKNLDIEVVAGSFGAAIISKGFDHVIT